MAQGFTQNSVFLTGNVSRDPEGRHTPNGTYVYKFGLAVNNRKKVGDQWENDPCFIDVVVFGKRGEQLEPLMDKGQRVMVEGRLQYRQWDDADGNKRSKHELVADLVNLIVNEQSGGGQNSPRRPSNDDRRPGRSNDKSREPGEDDDVPF